MARWMNVFLFGGAGAATKLGDAGLAVMRVGTGLLMMVGHGLGKMWGPDRFGPPPKLVEGVEAMGFPAPPLFAWMAGLAEFLGAGLIALGLLTRPAAVVLVGNMAVAAFIAHGNDPLFLKDGSPAKEFALLYLLPFLMLACTGGGRYAVDHLLRKG